MREAYYCCTISLHMERQYKIGFFDSGLGGLTILTAVRKYMPEYEYVYYGDTENIPYGDKSEEDIYRLTKCGVEELFQRGAVLVVVACNTASVASVRKLQDEVIAHEYPDRRVLGVIIPTIETLLSRNPHHALLIGTTRTVASSKFEVELKKQSNSHTLTARATPTLVPLIEAGEYEKACEVARAVIDETNEPFDAVILGCTHYTTLKECLRASHPHLAVISQDEIIPTKLHDYLLRHPEIEGRLSKKGSVEIHLSKESPQYEKIKKEILSHSD